MASLTIQQAYELALQHHRAGRLGPAEALYRQVLSYQPSHAESLSMLGLLTGQQGKDAESLELSRRAVELEPRSAVLHFNLGRALSQMGHVEEALAAYQTAIALQPGLFEAHNNLGNLLRKAGRMSEAIAALRTAVNLRPDSAATHFNLGNALREVGASDEASAAFSRTASLQPDHAEAHLNLGNLQKMAGRTSDAVESYRQAIAARPGYPEARWSLGLIRLAAGQLEEGWRLYEARLEVKDFPVRTDFQQPIWDGSALNGRRILLHPEGGFGDTLQFIRYAALIHQKRGGRVFVQCQPELKRLFIGQLGIERVFASGEELQPFDVHCPLLSLPQRFGTTLETIPHRVPYLHASPTLADGWKARLGERKERKIGLIWAGSAQHLNDANRSMPIRFLAPLEQVQGVRFISLQRERVEAPPGGLKVESYVESLNNFADTAALISQLDLVICVDTSVAHLSGALGKPTWVLLAEPAEWRWLRGREDSPWYPTMRLFRQPRSGDWNAVMKAVMQALHAIT